MSEPASFFRPKINPIAAWTDEEIQAYIDNNDVLVNPLVFEGYPSIGCAPCTSKVLPGEDPDAADVALGDIDLGACDYWAVDASSYPGFKMVAKAHCGVI